MRKKLLYGISVLFIAFSGGGGCNLFTDASNRNSDAAIFDDATNLINAGLWNDAILKLQTMSTAGQAQRATLDLFASAYAGRGGLNLINLVNTLNGSGQPPSFFLTLFKAFKGSTYNNFLDQVTAESYITNISPNLTSLTTDEALFLIFVEFAKMGTLFASVADPTATGSIPPAFDSCTGFTNYQANEVALAIGLIVNALPVIGNNAIVTGALAPIEAACTAGTFSCGIIDPSTAPPPIPEGARTLIGESHLGIGLQTVPQKDKCEFTAPNGNCEGAGAPVTVCTP